MTSKQSKEWHSKFDELYEEYCKKHTCRDAATRACDDADKWMEGLQ